MKILWIVIIVGIVFSIEFFFLKNLFWKHLIINNFSLFIHICKIYEQK